MVGKGKGERSVVARPASVTSWDPAISSDASREFLQRRLATFCLTILSLYTVVSVIVIVFFELGGQAKPAHYATAVVADITCGAAMLITGLLLRRREFGAARTLLALDVAFLVAIGLAGAVIAYGTSDRRVNGYLTLTLDAFIIVGRALLVPSTRRRTFVVSTIAILPVVTAYTAIAAVHPVYLAVTPGAWIVGTLVIAGVAVALAAIGSGVIYGLRRQVHAAQQLGQYTLVEKLGEGGMGVVYKASHRLLRRPTAIKILREDVANDLSLVRFEREVQLTSELTHPNTISIFDFGRSHDGTFYYVMEYLDGVDLDKLVRHSGPVPAARVVHLLGQVCGALSEAHDRGLIHRDIKPANIIVTTRGNIPDTVKVVDFGLVKRVDQDGRDTAHEVIAGTPGYLAPEAITDPGNVGPSVDLYAIGVVAYFLLTGELLFEGTAVEVCGHHVVTKPGRPSARTDNAMSPALEQLVLDCLAKKPEQRPASAADLADRLAAVPEAGTWTTQNAAAWWADYSSSTDAAGTAATTVAGAPRTALTVDLVRGGHAEAETTTAGQKR